MRRGNLVCCLVLRAADCCCVDVSHPIRPARPSVVRRAACACSSVLPSPLSVSFFFPSLSLVAGPRCGGRKVHTFVVTSFCFLFSVLQPNSSFAGRRGGYGRDSEGGSWRLVVALLLVDVVCTRSERNRVWDVLIVAVLLQLVKGFLCGKRSLFCLGTRSRSVAGDTIWFFRGLCVCVESTQGLIRAPHWPLSLYFIQFDSRLTG